VVKPVQTGMGEEYDEIPDVEVVRALAGCDVLELTRLSDPLAPDSATRLRNGRIPRITEYAEQIRALAEQYDCVLVEGAGGLLVRLDTDGGTLLDLADALGAEVVVVVSPGLGTLNHTELTVQALRGRGIEPVGLALGAWPAEPGLAETCNRRDLPRVSGVRILLTVPAGAGTLEGARFRQLAPTWFD